MNQTKPKFLTNLLVVILVGSGIISLGILLSTFLKLTMSREAMPKDAEKIYQNITYIRTDGSPYLGNKDAPVTVIEYIDFECPICKRVYDEIFPKLRDEYLGNNKVKFVFKNMPIDGLHRSALRRAGGAYCAGEQAGNAGFFRYHDELFNLFSTIQDDIVDSYLMSIARGQGLDEVEFMKCLSSEKYKDKIDKDLVEAIAINANGTPTWLIGKSKDEKLTDTVKLNGLYDYYVYKTVIDQLLAEEVAK